MKNFLIFFILFIFSQIGFTCTTGVFSGQATKDCKPILWKNRDSNHKYNQVVYAQDGLYSYFAMVNEGDSLALDVWAGINEKGFAIMNSASYNVEIEGKPKDGEGRFMKLALQTCKTINDFEKLLQKTKFYRDVNANFGVIDSFGGAAYFETNCESYTKFDANKTKSGFIVRTNYSVTGKKGEGYGFIRKERADFLILNAVSKSVFSVPYLINNVSKDIFNLKTGLSGLKNAGTKYHYINASDTINRYSTVSVSVFQGVKKGDNPENSIFWAMVGNPVVSVSVPIFVKSEQVPKLLQGQMYGKLDEVSNKLRNYVFPFPKKMGSLNKYMDVNPLFGKGKYKVKLLTEIIAVQNTVFDKTKAFCQNIDEKTKKQCIQFQNQISEFVYNRLNDILGFLENEN